MQNPLTHYHFDKEIIMRGRPSERLNFNQDEQRTEQRSRSAINGSTCTDDRTTNRYIMRPARKNRKPKSWYLGKAPKILSPEEYAKVKA